MRSDLIDITVFLHGQTERAVLVSTDGERDKAVWIPKAWVEIEPEPGSRNHVLTIPEHQAVEKGLV